MLNMKCLRLSTVENLFSCLFLFVVLLSLLFFLSYDSNLKMFWTVFSSCKEIRSLNLMKELV